MTRASLFAFTTLAAACAGPALADSRIRDLAFDPSAVTPLAGCPGFQSTVAFAPGERIENIAVGDANLWQAIPNKRADLLFLKPVKAAAHTNMTVVTDRRRYSFELATRPSAACRAGQVVYDLRFTYPDEPPPVVQVAAAPVAPVAPEDPVPPPSARNSAYTFAGAAANVPVRAFDDGTQTWLRWADGVAAPAIYLLGSDKTETLANYTVVGDYLVIDQVTPALVLRRGAVVATLFNDAYQAPKLDAAAPQPRTLAAAAAPSAHRSVFARLFGRGATQTGEIAR